MSGDEGPEKRLEELTLTKIKAEEEVSQALQRETLQLREDLKEQEEESLAVLQTLKLIPEPEVSEEKLPEKKRCSVWKRVRHFLGLRKKSKQRQESTSNQDSYTSAAPSTIMCSSCWLTAWVSPTLI